MKTKHFVLISAGTLLCFFLAHPAARAEDGVRADADAETNFNQTLPGGLLPGNTGGPVTARGSSSSLAIDGGGSTGFADTRLETGVSVGAKAETGPDPESPVP